MLWNIPLINLGQLSWLCPLPARVGKTEDRDTVQALFSNSQNTGVLPILFQPQIQSTAPYGLL